MRGLTVIGVIVLSGCRNGDKNGGDGTSGIPGVIYAEADPPELVLTLDSPSTIAGTSLGFSLELHYDDGDIEPVEGPLVSDLEPDMLSTWTSVQPTVVGDHTLGATIYWDEGGENISTEGTLTVTPGEVHTVNLVLSDLAMQAGQSVDYWIEAADAWGNPVDASAAEVSTSSTDLSVASSQVTGTIPGIYELEASLNEASDSELLVVTPGEAVSVDLELSSLEVELYETVSAQITVLDDYGNLTSDPWTLSVTGDGLTSVSYANVTFWDEGEYWVRVDVDDTSLWDEEGPILVDSTGPEITIEQPERGAWVWGYEGIVSGTVTDDWSGIADLDVNGAVVTVAADGSFTTDLDYEFGTNVIETAALDGDDNLSVDTRSVLAGSFLEYGEYASAGIVARLHEGEGGLDALAALGEGLIDSNTLSDLIPSPVYSASEQSCWTILWWEECITWYSVNLYITNPTISGTGLDLDPKSSGYLEATFTVEQPSLDWSASGTVIGIGYSGSGDVTAEDISVWMELGLYVDNNTISADINDTAVSSTNFSFDVDSWLYDVLDWFGVDFDGLVQGYMEDALDDAIRDEVPALVEDLFQDLELSTEFEVLDEPLSMTALPEDIEVDETGMGEGSLHYGYATPSWTGSPGMILGLNADLLNQLFYGLWGAGVLELTLTEDDLGISAEDLSILFPEMTGLTITTDPLLPITIVPDSTGSSIYELQFGDMLVTIWNGEVLEGNELLQVYVAGFGGFDVEMSSDGALDPILGEMDLYFDVIVPEANTAGAADTEELFAVLMPTLLDSMIGGLSSLPIPEIDGFMMTSMTVSSGGAEGGFVTVEGDISE
jgi:hypothetical protein